MSRRPSGARKTEAADAGPSPLRAGTALFALALALRLLYWQATPDAAWPYVASFKGDAVVWLEYARALQQGRQYELGLPIHPPATPYLVSALWNGRSSGFSRLRFWWAVFGALAAALTYWAARGPCGERAARLAGGITAVAAGPLILSNAVDTEMPYLVVALSSLVLAWRLHVLPSLTSSLAWGALGGLACLFRVEHVAVVALSLPWVCRRSAPRAGLALAGFVVVLLPWHVKSWRSIARFNDVVAPEHAAQLAEASALGWDEAAARWRDALPAFARPTGAAFVARTVAHRGGTRVTLADTQLLEEAFDYTPQAIARFPFVSLYGPLNFALANNAAAAGGFSPALLEAQPPLRPSAASYPPALVTHLPPPQLAFVYPPHLRLVNEGHALGWAWLRAHPGNALRLVGRKLHNFWAGAAAGLGGYNLPLGAAGTRRAVDCVTADDTPWSTAWRLGLLALCLAGLVAAWRRPGLWPWLALGAAKLLAAAAFFGYARLGAGLVPVAAVLWALALERWVWKYLPERAFAFVPGLALALVALEGARSVAGPEVFVDGRPITRQADPFPLGVHRDQRIGVR